MFRKLRLKFHFCHDWLYKGMFIKRLSFSEITYDVRKCKVCGQYEIMIIATDDNITNSFRWFEPIKSERSKDFWIYGFDERVS